MKRRKKEKKQPERAFPQTLGMKLLSFWKSRYASKMNVVPQMVREDASILKSKPFGRFGFQPNRSSVYYRQAPIFLDKFRQFVLSKLDTNKTKKEKTRYDEGTTLPPSMLNFFSRLLRIRLPSVQIHQDGASEQFLKAHHADAVTVGHDIFFRAGKLDLRSEHGLGLLGHELTHVVQQHTSDWRNPNAGNRSEHFERKAIENERLVLLNAQTPKVRETLFSYPALISNTGSVEPPPQIMEPAKSVFADASRNVSELPDTGVANLTMSSISVDEMMRIKEEVYRDLMMRIKVDFERGA